MTTKKVRIESLTRLFKRLGASDPAGWARSQVEEGIRQLPRYVFLRQAWRLVIDENDHRWIAAEIRAAEQHPDAPGAGIGHSIKRLLASGADRRDLTELVRGMQWTLLSGLCYMLEDPGDLEPEIENMTWGLYEHDRHGNPKYPIDGLHESVLHTDPTGREMRPRRTTANKPRAEGRSSAARR